MKESSVYLITNNFPEYTVDALLHHVHHAAGELKISIWIRLLSTFSIFLGSYEIFRAYESRISDKLKKISTHRIKKPRKKK